MKFKKGVTKPHGLRVIIYGIPGSGKTTLASKLRNALFLDYEYGSHGLDVTKVIGRDLPMDYSSFKGEILSLAKDHQGFETVVIDSCDRMEQFMDKSYSEANKIESVFAANDYGRTVAGHNVSGGQILEAVNKLVESGMNVVWVCHEQKRKIEPLEGPKVPNDHAELKVSKGWSKLWTESADWIIYIARKTFSVEGDKKTGEKAHLEGGKLWAFNAPSNDWDAKHRASIKVADDLSLDKLGDTFQAIIDASIERAESPHDVPVAIKASFPDAKVVSVTGPDGEKMDDHEDMAHVQNLMDAIEKYSVDMDKFIAYAGEKLKTRFGLPPDTAIVNWPEHVANWFTRGMDKISAKIK